MLLQDPVQHAWQRQRERKQLLQQLATQPVRPPITRLPANVTLEEVERVDAIRRGHPGLHKTLTRPWGGLCITRRRGCEEGRWELIQAVWMEACCQAGPNTS